MGKLRTKLCKSHSTKKLIVPFADNFVQDLPTVEKWLPSHNGTVAEHISLWTICLSHPNIWAFSGTKKVRVLIEIPLPQVTEHADQLLQSEASHPGTAWSSNMLFPVKSRKIGKHFQSTALLLSTLKWGTLNSLGKHFRL